MGKYPEPKTADSGLTEQFDAVVHNGYPKGYEKVVIAREEYIRDITRPTEPEAKPSGLRYDKGKIRFDLLESFAIEKIAEVFTKGAEKYEANNWLKGMKWSKMRASLGRHLAAFDNRQDFDVDPSCPDCQKGACVAHTGLLHIAQVAWNALALLSYYKHFPEGDDRYKKPMRKIGLDIDEVICDWVGPWCKRFGHEDAPQDWNFSYKMKADFESLSPEDKEEHYLNLPARIQPSEIPFPFDCYVTARTVDVELTKRWLLKNNFPANPVYSLGWGESKLAKLKELGIEYFVDDNYKTFNELNENGIACFLMDAPHNRRYDVGYRRVVSLKDFYDRFLK